MLCNEYLCDRAHALPLCPPAARPTRFDETQIAADAATFPFGIVQGKSLDTKSDAGRR